MVLEAADDTANLRQGRTGNISQLVDLAFEVDSISEARLADSEKRAVVDSSCSSMAPRLALACSMTPAIELLLADSWSIRPIAVDCRRFSTIFIALAVSSARVEIAFSVSPVRAVRLSSRVAFSARRRSALC
jgi:hypothetical protein